MHVSGIGLDQSHYDQSWLWSRLHTTLAQVIRITPKGIYTVLKIFSPFRIFEQLALALKNRFCPENFRCIEYIFYHSGFLSNFALALKNRVCPENFHCIEHTYYIQDFGETCACPEKQSVPWINPIKFIFFIIQDFEQLAFIVKNSVALKFFTVLKFFYHSGFLSNLHVPWKQSLP